MILQFFIAMAACASFAVLFGMPRDQFLFSSFTGALGWISYLIFCELGAGTVFASLFAAFFLTILSRFFAAVRKNPVTLYLVTGFFRMEANKRETIVRKNDANKDANTMPAPSLQKNR